MTSILRLAYNRYFVTIYGEDAVAGMGWSGTVLGFHAAQLGSIPAENAE